VFLPHGAVARILARVLLGAALLSAASLIPLAPSASATLEVHTVTVESGVAAVGYDRVVDLKVGAEMVGFTWDGRNAATINVRSLVDGTWSSWASLDGGPDEGPDASTREHRSAGSHVSAGPTWLGHDVHTIEVQVLDAPVHALTAHAIVTKPPAATTGVQPAGAETPLPFVETRAQWGADESLRCSETDYASGVDFAVVHHTVNSNNYAPSDSAALVRGIFLYHTQVNGWCDIGYNFLIDRFGQIFEGRFGGINQAVIGAHSGGFNARSTGVALIGDFTSAAPSDAAYQSLRRLLDWKLAYHHIDPMGTTTHTVAASDCNCQSYPVGTTVTVATISGHRDLDQTGCPGNALYALLPQLRAQVAMDIGQSGPGAWTCQWDQPSDYGPGAVSPYAGRDDVFVRGDDGQLWQKVHTVTGTSPWSPLGGYLTSDPDASSRAGGRLDVFARGSDGALWHRAFTGIVWTPWESLGGRLSSAPTAVSWSASRIDVFACGVDGAVWSRAFTGTSWTPWYSLGGIALGAPSVSSDGNGHLDVIVRGADGGVYDRAFRDGSWSAWTGIAQGATNAGPGSVSWGPDRTDVFVRASDGSLWANSATASGWVGWYPLGGVITSDPDVSAPGVNQLVVTARGQDARYWQRRWTGTAWTAWQPI
jgi:hypothetical protein